MSTHECTLGHLMEGQVIDGVFYCAHGVALGTPKPVQPDPPLAIKATFPPYGWCPSLEAPVVDSDGSRAHRWITDAHVTAPYLEQVCVHCHATIREPLPVTEQEQFLYEQGEI